MLIREMSQAECFQVLAGARLARLACARDNQPYIVPTYLCYYEETCCLYGFTTRGQKVEWMRTNPLVCVEVDEITSSDKWFGVIVSGRYEELEESTSGNIATPRPQERPYNVHDTEPTHFAHGLHSKCNDERELAWQLLKNHPEWWEPGSAACAARVHRDPAEPYVPIYYRIHIDQVTGHEATRDPQEAIATTPPVGSPCWLCGAISRVFRGVSSP